MTRPQSIIWFERFYLGALALGLLNTMLNWSVIQQQLGTSAASSILPGWFMPAILGIAFAINLLLWYLVARRRSVVAKWFVTVLFIIGLFGLLGLVRGQVPGRIVPFTILNYLLNAAAVVMLFRPDTKRWFAGKRDLGETFS